MVRYFFYLLIFILLINFLVLFVYLMMSGNYCFKNVIVLFWNYKILSNRFCVLLVKSYMKFFLKVILLNNGGFIFLCYLFLY